MSDDDLLKSLTDSQRQAVQHVDGPLLILAGPGSGKTRVVTHRIAYLLRHGVPARHILALTFTNKAADEMRVRLTRLAPRQPVWMGTFHRYCAAMLRQHASLVGLHENYSILDMDDARKVFNLALEDAQLDLTHTTPESIASAISWAKNNLITPDRYEPKPGNHLGSIVEKVYPAYQKRLLSSNAVDFDDLLMHVAMMLRENPELRRTLDERFRYIMVDEYQDTNLAQYAIVRALSIDYPNLAATGDPDQSIYGWRGADLNNILGFEKDFPQVRVVRLEQNYRSTKNILRVADVLISHNVKRKEKELYTDNADGKKVKLVVFPTQRDEAEQIAISIATDVHHGKRRPRDFAIFYRTNALSRQLEHSLGEQGVPYQIIHGVEFYQRKEIKDVVAYLQLLNNPQNDVAFRRVINVPVRGIGKTTIDRLAEHADRYQIPLLEAARECGLIQSMQQRSALAVAKFVSLYDRLRVLVTHPVEEILRAVLAETGYRLLLEHSETEEDAERLANIEELVTAAREFDEQNPGDAPLERFLEQAALVNDTDDLETDTDKVTLMTLHAAKGLEFPVVFIVAVEQGLIPHERNKDDADRLEEERRLLFVGITRAEEELQLSLAQNRSFRGGNWPTVPSPFLMELPREEMEVIEPSRARWSRSEFDEGPPDDAEFADAKFSVEDGGDEGGGDVWRDDEFNQDVPSKTRQKPPVTYSKIVTGAQMLDEAPRSSGSKTSSVANGSSPSSKVSLHIFQEGMLVRHPEYGNGVILAISGADMKRTASVRFLKGGIEKKFRLAFSGLQPVQSSE